ncbi:MAG: hypothetical protein JWM82_1071 [Myxococcales bacterium]|nr:hypothetical protein [Myxococcales bacterium]
MIITQRLLGGSTREATFIRHVVRNWKVMRRVVSRKLATLARVVDPPVS